MHINEIGFLNTTSRNIMFVTVSMIKNRKIKNIADEIIQVHKLYLQCGFKITHMHTDCEFEPLRKEMTAIGSHEDIYGPSIPHLKVKTVRHKIQHVEPVKITGFPKTILDKYNEVAIGCDLMQINGIGFVNAI